ncbi:MAG: HAD hydrolase family protein [Candidatus Omnitrophota bacterium]
MRIHKYYDLKKVKLIVYDFDGVFTDNKVILMEDGKEGVIVNRSDGLAVSIFKKMGIPQIILSTERNPIVKARSRKLGIPALTCVNDKKKDLSSYCRKLNIPLHSVAYIGNDINDYEAMLCVGFPIAPADANSRIKGIAEIVTKTRGGEGVARELLDIFTRGMGVC